MNDPILLKMKDLYAVGKTKEQRDLEWKDKMVKPSKKNPYLFTAVELTFKDRSKRITEPKLIAEYTHQSLLERIKGFVKKFL